MAEPEGEEKVGNLVNHPVGLGGAYPFYNLLHKIQALVCTTRGAWPFARAPNPSPIRFHYD